MMYEADAPDREIELEPGVLQRLPDLPESEPEHTALSEPSASGQDLPVHDVDAGYPGDAIWMEAKDAPAQPRTTASQATSVPFVFPSGSRFRSGARVNTLRDAMAHMDDHSDAGMQVLRDGTLAAWLDEVNAPELAREARDVVRQARPDLRIALESFLIRTGLVARPALRPVPALLDLGYVIQGKKAAGQLRLEKGRGRGYLFGEVTGRHPWVRVEPREFAGKSSRMVVTADTTGLPISADPYESGVAVASSASPEPTLVPVRLRVIAEPPRLVRTVVRPLIGLLLGAVAGVLLGLLWKNLRILPAPKDLAWALCVAVAWALAGTLRGLRQPPAWPAGYAAARWTAKAAAWSAALAVVAVVIFQAWRLGLGGGLELPGISPAIAALAGATLGFVPATLDELAQSRRARNPSFVQGSRMSRRGFVVAGAALALLIVVMLAPRAVTVLADDGAVQAKVDPARTWVEARWNEFDLSTTRAMNDFMLRYYSKPGQVAGAATPEPQGFKLPAFLGGK